MHVTRAAALLLSLLATSCVSSSDAGTSGGTPSAVPTSVAPSYPAGAYVFDGATATIPMKAVMGNLRVVVESKRSARGTAVELQVSRQEDCHMDEADKEAHLFVCTTVYDRRKALPPSAFTFDGTLGTATVTTTIEGRPFTMTWTGFGDTRRQVNENGALLIEARDATVVAQWGRVRHADTRTDEVFNSLFHRVSMRG